MRCALVGLLLVAGCHALFPLEKAPPDASDDAGQPTRRRKVTITNPTSTPLIDFPVSITTQNDADLMTHASADGEDLQFVLGGSVALAKEIVRFDEATGTLDAWVKIPELRPGANEIHLEYGGAAVASPSAVWDPEIFFSVWHMSDGGQSEADRTNNERELIASTVATAPDTGTGIAGLARAYNALTHSLCANREYVVASEEGVSFSVWLRFTMQSGANWSPFHAGGVSGRGFAFVTNPLLYDVRVHDGTNQIVVMNGSGFVGSPRWYQVVGVVERGAGSLLRLYLDGAQVKVSNPETLLGVMSIGPCLGKPFIGLIDEARVYRGTLHPDWIRAEFSNLSDRPAFVKIDDPQ